MPGPEIPAARPTQDLATGPTLRPSGPFQEAAQPI